MKGDGDRRGGAKDGAFARTPIRAGQLLAGVRRRAVDDAARHHLPPVGVHAGAVLPVARSDGKGRGAGPAQPADRGADQSPGAGAHPEGRRRDPDRDPYGDARVGGARAEAAQGRGGGRRDIGRRRRARGGDRERARLRESRSPPRRSPKSTSSISRSARCASSSPRSRTRSPHPKRPTGSRSRRSPTSASGSTSRSPRRCRSSTAIARISSAV